MSASLQTAIQGGKVPDSKKSSVLAEALDKVKSVKNQLSRAKEVGADRKHEPVWWATPVLYAPLPAPVDAGVARNSS